MSDTRLAFERRALAIVEQCLDAEPADRDALAAAQCGADAPLAAHVRRLLAESERDDAPVSTEHRDWLFEDIVIPERIDRFRIVREIGRGGMGVVLEGARDDGLFDQRVAIKLMRGNVDSLDALERFNLERRILARLNGPDIVRIIDGGSYQGHPYLAMDLIEGQILTDHVRIAGAGLDERLRLFRAACEAVRFAHRKLVVHGDIKPSNILVDQAGVVKLVDFGIARLIDEGAQGGGGSDGLTRGYAAPERRDGDGPSVPADVFALGGVLFELLTGAPPPPDAARLAPSRLAGHAAPVPARRIAGDLDAIVARATATAPADRYPDIAALIADLDRYRAHVPITARPAGPMLRAGRFVRRHAPGFALASAAALLLTGTAIVTTVQYRRAEEARAQADRRFLEVRDLARFMLFDLYDRLADTPGTAAQRVRIANAAQHYLDRLMAVPTPPLDVRMDAARAYRKLATVQGVSGTASIGRPDLALRSLDRSEQLLRAILAARPADADALAELGWVTASRWTLKPDSNGSMAENARARALFDRALRARPGLFDAVLGRLATIKNAAYDSIWALDRPGDAIAPLRAGLAELRALKAPPQRENELRAMEVQLLARLGDATYYAGDMPGALAPYRESEAIIRRALARGPSLGWSDRLGEAAFNISGTLGDTGRSAEALDSAREGAEAMKAVLAAGYDDNIEKRLAVLLRQESVLLMNLGQLGGALRISGEDLAIRERRAAALPGDWQRRRDLAIGLLAHARLADGASARKTACDAAGRAVTIFVEMRRAGNLGTRDAAKELPDAELLARKGCGSLKL